jgi:hypothetical protein
MRPISNLNSVLVKNYGSGSDTLAVIRELKKLGIIKSVAKAKGKAKPKMIEDIKQENDMVGYVKTLDSPQMRNLAPIQQIQAGASQQQIEDINRTNVARFAQLEAAATQQQQQIGGLAGLAQGFFSVINPGVERFRGSTFPAQARGDEPIDPFATRRPGVIYLSDIPETSSGSQVMTETLNPNAPDIRPELATSIFPEEEQTGIELTGGGSRIQPQQKISLVLSSQQVADDLGLGKIPTMRNSYTAVENFYIALTDALQTDREANADSKSKILAEINKLLEKRGEL